jgi:formylglycine-generating enzyme required for sulfatase activity
MKRLLHTLFALLLIGTAAWKTNATPEAGDIRTDAHGIEQVYVPAGCFLMGSSDAELEYARSLDAPSWAISRIIQEQAQHEVCLSEGYWLDRYEVTNAAFDAFVEGGGYTTREYWSEMGLRWLDRQDVDALPVECAEDSAPDHPRVCITWYEAEAYARWRGGALPTEAQWEYAARGPESLIYPWGNEWNPELANVVDSDGTTPVGSYPDGTSWVGALDMSGNAMEWVNDWLVPRYSPDAVTDPTGPENGRIKIEKGGWWGSNPVVARGAWRHFEDPPQYQDHHIGVRIVTHEE